MERGKGKGRKNTPTDFPPFSCPSSHKRLSATEEEVPSVYYQAQRYISPSTQAIRAQTHASLKAPQHKNHGISLQQAQRKGNLLEIIGTYMNVLSFEFQKFSCIDHNSNY